MKQKNLEDGFPGAIMQPMAASLIASMVSLLIKPVGCSMINAITGKGVMSTGKGQEDGFLPLIILPLMMKVLGKIFRRGGRGWIIWIKIFSPAQSFNQYHDY